MNVKEVLFELNDCQRVMDALEEEIELGGNVVLSNQDAKRTLEIVKSML